MQPSSTNALAVRPQQAVAVAQPLTQTQTQTRARAAASGEYLTFRIGDEEYALGILNVQEIRRYERPTRLPSAPAHALGVLDLRGVIVPVMDARTKLGSPAGINDATVTIVLNVNGRTLGLVVDAVADVQLLSPHEIHAAPDMCHAIEANCIDGVATVRDGDQQKTRTLLLLDVGHFMNAMH